MINGLIQFLSGALLAVAAISIIALVAELFEDKQ